MRIQKVYELGVKIVLALLMIAVGSLHFISPKGFERIVPAYLPWHRPLVYISGFFEILGGVGLLIPATRRAAAWGLIALYIAVFPANIHMALHEMPFYINQPQTWLPWARLPLQGALIYWAWLYTRT